MVLLCLVTTANKKLSCHRGAVQCSMSLEILLSHSRSLMVMIIIASHVLTHLLIHLSDHLCHHHHSHHPSLLQSFTPGLKHRPTFSTDPSHFYTPSTLDCLHDCGTILDLSCFSIYFQFVFYLAIQRSVWRDIKFAFCFFVRLRISQRRMVRSA